MRNAILAIFVAVAGVGVIAQQNRSNPCDTGNAGLTLPPGFCASVVADNVGRTRHITVSPRGDVYAILAAAGGRGASNAPVTGAVLALRDADGDGRFEQKEQFGPGLNGTGIAWHNDYLYVASNTQLVRFRMAGNALVPAGQPEVVIADLPPAGPHAAKPIVFGENNDIYIHVGAPTNACQEPDRRPGVAGMKPCPQLELHGGVWKYDASQLGQKHTVANRFTTGQRHTVGLAWNSATKGLYAVQNGRDQLDTLWPANFTAEDNANRPLEEMQRLRQGADFGWPYCFYDGAVNKRVQNPEYGGDGKAEGDCAKYDKPIATFPAHNAPVSMMFYTGSQFPAEYRNGAFVVFHGSWNRTPFAMDGFNVRFVPFKGDAPSGNNRVFATGFAGGAPVMNSNAAAFRPVGIAQARDGAIYISDDSKGRLWKISYTGR